VTSLRILTVVGARPQFVKAAPISRAITARDDLAEVMVHTGQHFDPEMSAIFFDELAIPAPDYNLDIHGVGHGAMTGRMLERLEAVIEAEKPTMVVIYGDTNSTLAGAVAAAKLNIPVAHVEAGLRSFNRRMPEETNRVLADHASDLLLCPTAAAVANLAREGITRGVHHVGDVMYDATLFAAEHAAARSDAPRRLGLEVGHYLLATLHRAENTDDGARLAQVLDYIRAAADGRIVVLPLHPRTRAAVERHGLALDGFRVTPPLGYLDMHRLVADAALAMTDSGGPQKEAYFYRVPAVTLRDETEWVETVDAGWNRLWRGPDYAPRRDIADYGDGQAAGAVVARIVEALEER